MARPSGTGSRADASVSTKGFDPARKYGPLGLLHIDELTIDGLATSIERLILNNCHGDGRERLRHALAAFLIRAQVGGEWREEEQSDAAA